MSEAQIGMVPSAAPSWRDLQLRDDVRRALAAVYAGAEALEADALLDQLDDLGLSVVRQVRT